MDAHVPQCTQVGGLIANAAWRESVIGDVKPGSGSPAQ